MKRKYFHELTGDEVTSLLTGDITWGEVLDSYPQPEWCQYPGALNGPMGCWSLISGAVTGETFCKNCDCYKPS